MAKETRYYTADALGSIVRLTDGYGQVAKAYAYDSFGNLKSGGYGSYDSSCSSGMETEQPYAYTGREYDRETGLYYYRARYYDPRVGRFMSKDPVGGFVVSPQTLNRYAYVTNNPVRYVDPSGGVVITGTLVAGACVVGAIGEDKERVRRPAPIFVEKAAEGKRRQRTSLPSSDLRYFVDFCLCRRTVLCRQRFLFSRLSLPSGANQYPCP